MEYMEMRMQEQIEAGIAKMDAIQEEFERFREWFMSIEDSDERLVDWKYMIDGVNFESPSDTATAMWIGWKASKGL